MFESILSGEKPTQVFRRIIQSDPSITNSKLSKLFREEFEHLDGFAAQIIWKWKGPEKTQGINDESVDAELIKLLKDANYL
jgi:hypothetical protein